MRLFTKTYLFFIVVILFQSAFTIVLVTESVGHANIEDARRELLFEAKKVSSDFSEAERSLWKDLAGMMNDEDLKKADMSGISAVEIIRSGYNASGARFVELYDVSGVPEVFSMEGSRPVPGVSFSSLPFYDFPSIRRVLADGRLYLVGSVRYKTGHAFRLIIEIDYTFVRQLAYGQNTQVLLFAGQRYIIGTLGEMLPKDFHYSLLFDAAEAEYYNLRIDKEFANISVRQEGFLCDGLLSVPLQFVVSVSNVPYDKRLGSIRSALFVVSLLMAFVAMVIAYFLSRNISSPVGNFITAMNKLSAGEYEGVDENLYKSELKQLACGFNDMSMKLKENHRELERSIEEITMLKDYNEAVIQSIRSGIAIIDPLLRVEKVNRSFLDFFGVGEDVLLNFPVNLLPSEIIDLEHVKDITDILNGKKRYASRTQKTAGNRYIEYKLFPLIKMGGKDSEIYGCIILLEDVSRKVDYEAKIFQAEKLASVSMLSAGVAHEINNPLASILSNIQNLEEDASEGYQKDALLLVEKETRRIARIVRRLLDFAAPAAEGESSSDLSRAVEETLDLLNLVRDRHKRIAILREIPKSLPLARITSDELKQVLLNLIRNSVDSIALEGTVTVSVRMKDSMLVLEVRDTGSGIPAEILPRIFDPFFSTKANGKGTGLGLSIVYGIITRAGGSVSVESEIGKGTVVCVSLPAV